MAAPADADDAQSLLAWRRFLQLYASGAGPADVPPDMPALSAPVEEGEPAGYEELYERAGDVSETTARRVRHFYQRNRFLPPPKAPDAAARALAVKQHTMFGADQQKNYDSCTRLLHSFFGHFISIAVIEGSSVVVQSRSHDPPANFPVELGRVVKPELALSGHAVLRAASEVCHIGDVENDWRFAGHPFRGVVGGYVGVPIGVRANPAEPEDRRMVIVGSINLFAFGRPFDPLTEQQLSVLRNVQDMLQTLIQATWEQGMKSKFALMRTAVTDFVDVALVGTNDTTPAPVTPMGRVTPLMGAEVETIASLSQRAVTKIQAVLPEADWAAVVDLSSIHGHISSDGQLGVDYAVVSGAPFPAKLIASACSRRKETPDALHANYTFPPEAQPALFAFLRRHRSVGRDIVFSRSAREYSCLEPLLPMDTVSHIAFPFFIAGQPTLLLLVGTYNPQYLFSATDKSFAQSMGVVLKAHAVQTRVLEADAAKTTFLSSISHELRTPLSGLLNGLDLMRGDLETIPSCAALEGNLEAAEAAGYALQSILNDVLDFGKLQNTNAKTESNKTDADLEMIVLETSRTCVKRERQYQSLQGGQEEEGPRVVIQVEDRSPGNWEVRLDEPGFRRIWINFLSNALKYSSSGTITLSISSCLDDEGRTAVKCVCADQGRGISPEFLSNLFQPFKQADGFTPGAGLGLYITKALVGRMRGKIWCESTLGQGTTFFAILPVEFLSGEQPTWREDGTGAPIWSQHVLQPENDAKLAKALRRLSHGPTGRARSAVSSGSRTPRSASPEMVAEEMMQQHAELRVLVVDDNSINRRSLVALLKRYKDENVIVREACDGEQAVEVYKEFHPQLCWSDVSMPKLDGVSMAVLIREYEKEQNLPKCHIVAITGLGSSDQRLRADALLGRASLDEWRVKGQDSLDTFREGLRAAQARLGPPPPMSAKNLPPTTTAAGGRAANNASLNGNGNGAPAKVPSGLTAAGLVPRLTVHGLG